jgi:hypothetical protein
MRLFKHALRQLTWVDLRSQALDRGIAILVKAASGEALGSEFQEHFDSVRASICPYGTFCEPNVARMHPIPDRNRPLEHQYSFR